MHPLAIMATVVTAVLPTRSASSPAATQPIPPTAITQKAIRLAADSEPDLISKASARKTGTQVHIA